MPTLHIDFNPTGGTLFTVKYRRSNTLDPWVEQSGFTGSPIDITVPFAAPYDFCIKKICPTTGTGAPSESWEVCGVADIASDCVTPTFAFISRNGADFTFSYGLQPNQPMFQLQILDPNGTLIGFVTKQAITTPSPFTESLPSLISGTYQFRIRGVCGPYKLVSPTSNWTAYIDVVVGVSGCVAPSDIVEQLCQIAAVTNGSSPMPNAVVGSLYKHIVYLTGTAPFDCNLDDAPAWMSANYVLDGGGNHTIELTGTPDAVGLFDIGLQIKNCGNDYASGTRFDSALNVVAGLLVQEFSIINTTASAADFNLLVNTVDVSGLRALAAGATVGVNASGALINNPSSEVIVQFPIDISPYPGSAELTYSGGPNVTGVWDNIGKKFTFTGVNTSAAQSLAITLTT